MKTLLACVACLLTVRLALGAPDMLALASKGDVWPREFKPALDALPPGEINRIADAGGRTMLHLAAAYGQQVRVLALLLSGADVNLRDRLGRTPLCDTMLARTDGDMGESSLMVLEMLTYVGADVNARAEDGTTPLSLAAKNGDTRKAAFLLWRGASPNPAGVPAEKTPLAVAKARGDEAMTALLESSTTPGPLAASTDRRRLFAALTAADLNPVLDALDAGWNIDEQDEKGRTALMRAVEANRPDLVTLLVFEGADPNLAMETGLTPLMAAFRQIDARGQRIAALLILSGADGRAVKKDGTTTLAIAVAAGSEFYVQWAIWLGADPLAVTPKGSIMQYVDHPPIRGLLREYGVPDEERKPREEPAGRLIEAVKKGAADEVEAFLRSGIPPDALLPEDQRSALTWAVCYNRFDLVDLLVKYGGDIDRQYSTSGLHNLHTVAARSDSAMAAKIMRQLLERGADPNVRTHDGKTPLMFAAKQGVTDENTTVLLEAGAKLDLRDREGLTALGVAKKYGREKMAALLKARGAID